MWSVCSMFLTTSFCMGRSLTTLLLLIITVLVIGHSNALMLSQLQTSILLNKYDLFTNTQKSP